MVSFQAKAYPLECAHILEAFLKFGAWAGQNFRYQGTQASLDLRMLVSLHLKGREDLEDMKRESELNRIVESLEALLDSTVSLPRNTAIQSRGVSPLQLV